MTISDGVLRQLEGGAKTVDELADLLFIPKPHIRCAVSELLHQERLITCDAEGTFALGEPSDRFPKTKKP